mgnify:CR=1 FL=1
MSRHQCVDTADSQRNTVAHLQTRFFTQSLDETNDVAQQTQLLKLCVDVQVEVISTDENLDLAKGEEALRLSVDRIAFWQERGARMSDASGGPVQLSTR